MHIKPDLMTRILGSGKVVCGGSFCIKQPLFHDSHLTSDFQSKCMYTLCILESSVNKAIKDWEQVTVTGPTSWECKRTNCSITLDLVTLDMLFEYKI